MGEMKWGGVDVGIAASGFTINHCISQRRFHLFVRSPPAMHAYVCCPEKAAKVGDIAILPWHRAEIRADE